MDLRFVFEKNDPDLMNRQCHKLCEPQVERVALRLRILIGLDDLCTGLALHARSGGNGACTLESKTRTDGSKASRNSLAFSNAPSHRFWWLASGCEPRSSIPPRVS